MGETEEVKISSGLKKLPFYQALRHQLNEQSKSLESRLEAQLSVTGELQEFFRKRSEVELEYSRGLEKIKFFQGGKGKKEPSQTQLSSLLQQFLLHTKKESKERLVLSEVCGLIVNRLGLISEDLQRGFRQTQQIHTHAQEELTKVLQELYNASKQAQAELNNYNAAEIKVKSVESKKFKLEEGLTQEKIEKSKKCKGVGKELLLLQQKTLQTKLSFQKAKNEYILCLDAANAAIEKYFVEDLSDLIDCMDLGYYESVVSCVRLYLCVEEVQKEEIGCRGDVVGKILGGMDCRVDKRRFLLSEGGNQAFLLPKKLDFSVLLTYPTGFVPTAIGPSLETPPLLQEELTNRLHLLERRVTALKTESNELWKTLETAESSLIGLIDEGWGCGQVKEWFAVGGIANSLLMDGKEGCLKYRSDRLEIDEFHVEKFHSYLLTTSRLSRLSAKYNRIKSALGLNEISDTDRMRRRIGHLLPTQKKVFGGSIEEPEVPLIIKSCVRVISMFGMKHQGIFRVSGSTIEINNFRGAFERGEDPLSNLTDASDINSVASLLKLYLRELREPLFPIVFFDVFMEVAQLEKDDFILRMKEIVRSLGRGVHIVLRYLFTFLNHLTDFSEENMMDPYNLAICFGPTLVPVPEDKDQVQYQNLVNELIKNVITYANEIFSGDCGGEVYERGPPPSPTPTPPIQNTVSSTPLPQISPTPIPPPLQLPATALYDFKSRSPREINLKKGQKLTLIQRVSKDWWKGGVVDEGELGLLIPDKYVKLEDVEEPTPSTSEQAKNRLSLEKFTPDLVLDLPEVDGRPQSDAENVEEEEEESSEEESQESVVTSAEVFANQQCTLKPKIMEKPKLRKE